MTAQDPDPPDLRLAIAVTLVLLDDLWSHLTDDKPDDPADLLLRIVALRSVLRRIQQGMVPT